MDLKIWKLTWTEQVPVEASAAAVRRVVVRWHKVLVGVLVEVLVGVLVEVLVGILILVGQRLLRSRCSQLAAARVFGAHTRWRVAHYGVLVVRLEQAVIRMAKWGHLLRRLVVMVVAVIQLMLRYLVLHLALPLVLSAPLGRRISQRLGSIWIPSQARVLRAGSCLFRNRWRNIGLTSILPSPHARRTGAA